MFLLAFKAEIARSLKAELSAVALEEHPVFRTGQGELHAVAALHLKCHILGRVRGTIIHIVRAVVVPVTDICALGDDRCGHGQARRGVIFPLFLRAAHERRDHRADYKNEDNGKKIGNRVKNRSKPTPNIANSPFLCSVFQAKFSRKCSINARDRLSRPFPRSIGCSTVRAGCTCV